MMTTNNMKRLARLVEMEVKKELQNGKLRENMDRIHTIDDLAEILGYRDSDEFFGDNPGAVEAVITWATGMRVFRSKLDKYYG
jgi:hypothetical protein